MVDPGGVSGVSTEPPFLAGYVINLICTVKDPGFMEPPFCLLASYTTIKLALAYLLSVFESTSRMAALRYNRGPSLIENGRGQRKSGRGFKNFARSRSVISQPPELPLHYININISKTVYFEDF